MRVALDSLRMPAAKRLSQTRRARSTRHNDQDDPLLLPDPHFNLPREPAFDRDEPRTRVLGAAVDALAQLIAVIDSAGRLVATNEAWRERAAALAIVPPGLEEGDDYLDACGKLPAEAAARRLAEGVREVLAATTPEFLTQQRFGNGPTECWLLARVKAFGAAGVAAVVSLQDISPRKRAELELSRRSELLAEAEQIAQLGSWEWEIRTGRLTWSDQHFRMFGLEPGRFEPTFELAMQQLSPSEADRVRRAMARAIEDRADHLLEYRAVHKRTGVEHTYLSQGRVIQDGRGEVVRMVGTVQDITARKAMEESLRESEVMMRELLEERQQLARDLHDGIIQMLYAVGMMIEDAGRLIAVAPEAAAERIGRAVRDLNGVIRDVRRHIIGGESPPMTGPHLRAELAKLVQAMEVSAALRFSLRIDPVAAGLLTADEANHVLYIAREAMSNSLRHAHARNGSVTLSLQPGKVRLAVTDDGTGFDMLQVVRPTGGLHNIASRARELGAALTIVAQPGHGTRVLLDLPKETD